MKTFIANEGQKYIDEPMFIKPNTVSILQTSISRIFKNDSQPYQIQVGYQRVKLRWMKPDGKGGLIPK